MLIAIIKPGGWKGHAQGTYYTCDESEGQRMIQDRVGYDGVAFASLTTEQKNAVYAAVPEPTDIEDDVEWLFGKR